MATTAADHEPDTRSVRAPAAGARLLPDHASLECVYGGHPVNCTQPTVRLDDRGPGPGQSLPTHVRHSARWLPEAHDEVDAAVCGKPCPFRLALRDHVAYCDRQRVGSGDRSRGAAVPPERPGSVTAGCADEVRNLADALNESLKREV